jgi:hypothetical protein
MMKLVDQLVLNKEMMSSEDISVNDYTRHGEKFVNDGVL